MLSLYLEGYRSVHLCSVSLLCLTLCDPMNCSLLGYVYGIFPDKNTGVGCHFLLQGIFLTQESSLHLLDWQADSLPLSHLGSPLSQLQELIKVLWHFICMIEDKLLFNCP